jgi:signal transduction histidine kinase
MQYWNEKIAQHQQINRELRIRVQDGEERWISCKALPKSDEDGRPIRNSGVFLDITERKNTEQVMRKFERLSSAARLSASVAHEINNPLEAVVNLLYLAKSAPGVPQPVTEQLDVAEQELERVAHAARQALGFYRESAVAERIDIPALIDSVLKIFSTKIAAKTINVQRRFVKCKPVYGVRGELRQVVSNLIANAIDAVSEGGTIAAGTRPIVTDKESIVEITIADDGPGVSAQDVDRIFEPFFTTKSVTGTGLGLWIAKEIVERHRGTITLSPPDGHAGIRGARFTVVIPNESVST